MKPTPETDAFAIKFKTPCGEKYWVPVDIARKLECERDEARGQRDRLAAVLQSIRAGYGGQVADPDCDCGECEFLISIDNALQSLTTNSQDR